MTQRLLTFAAAFAVAVTAFALPAPAASPTPGAPSAAPAPATAPGAALAPKAKTRNDVTRASSAGQAAMRERQKKCGAEWRDAKAAGKVEKGMKWPQYWSACNKRLKSGA